MNKLTVVILAGAAAAALAGCGTDTTTTVTQTVKTYSNRVDRMAIPAINTVFIPSASKDAFNQGDPSTDMANWGPTCTATTEGLRAAVNAVAGFPGEDSGAFPASVPAATLTSVVIPDIVTIDLSKPVHFPNGRALDDDVINAELGLTLNRGHVLTGGPGISDGIDANDVAFLGTFPYLAAPHMSAP